MSIASPSPQSEPVDLWKRAAEAPASAVVADELSVGEIVDTVKRKFKLILATTLTFLLGALILNSVLPQTFQTQARILIDPRGLQVVDKEVTPGSSGNELNLTLVENEMRIVASDTVLSRVVNKLNLAQDPEFNGTERSRFAFIIDYLRSISQRPSDSEAKHVLALRNLANNVEVDRTSKSFIVHVLAASRDPVKAQLLANTIAEEYISERIKSRSNKAERGSLALTTSLVELRKRVEASEQAIEKYKKDNDIVGAAGQLLNEQQLAELNTRLGGARAEATRARARLDQINRLRRRGVGSDATFEAIQSPIISNLRGRLADIRRREAALSVSLLPSHPRMRQVRNERNSAQRQLGEEMRRIAASARLNAERANANVKSLTENLAKQKSVTSVTNEKSVKLRELEREAEANRSVYNAFLTRSRELAEQTRVDSSVAEIISPASRPLKSQRSTSILLLLSALAGLASGFGLAFLGDATDQHLRTVRQVKSFTGLNRVLEIPKLTDSVLPKRGLFGGLKQHRAICNQTKPSLPAFYETSPQSPASQAIADIAATLRSQFAGDTNPSVLLTAVDHGEAKSTVALNLALAAADAGSTVLVIDAEFERKSISRLTGASSSPGLLNVLDGSAQLSRVIVTSAALPFDILPAGHRQPHSSKTGKTRLLNRHILEMTRNYDLVIIDDSLLRNSTRSETWASVANAVYIVVREGLTRKEDLTNSMMTMSTARHQNSNAIFVTDA
ncbi:MAG: GumC family protein [Hyphomicrobiaceae bacterium]